MLIPCIEFLHITEAEHLMFGECQAKGQQQGRYVQYQ